MHVKVTHHSHFFFELMRAVHACDMKVTHFFFEWMFREGFTLCMLVKVTHHSPFFFELMRPCM